MPPPPSISRLSMAPSVTSTSLRSSRKSMAAPSSGFGSTGPSVGVRDPRPLRDKSFQNHMVQVVQEYLVSNNFEIEMKYPLTPKTLRSPTQKDFVLIFQWLYHRLDPGYKFIKSIDNEVYSLLRIMGYPYFDNINKSQLAAVGGQTWFTILGMIYWMVELCQSLEKYDQSQENAEKSDEDVLNDILERYSSNCYRAYLQNEHDFSEYRAETELEIEQFSQSMRNSISEAGIEIKDVRRRAEALRKEGESINLLDKKRVALESDLVKFKEYVENLERRKTKWLNALDSIHEELSQVSQQYDLLQSELAGLQDQMNARGITTEDVEKMWGEREQLLKSMDQLTTRYESISAVINEKGAKAQQMVNELDNAFEHYNAALYNIGIDDSAQLKLHEPLREDNLGRPAVELLGGKSIKNNIRPLLLRHRNESSSRLHELQSQLIQLQEQNDRVSETITEKEETVETLQARLNSDKIAYDELYDTMNSDSAASNAKIERLDRDIHAMRVTVQQGLLQLQQQCNAVDVSYDQLKDALEGARMEMNGQLTDMINSIVGFKLHIQESLEQQESICS